MKDLVSKTKEICNLFEIQPKRSKGQNFLVSSSVYDDIVIAAEINAKDEILEVGPGLGFLTVKLVKAARRVVAVELDDKLAAYVQSGFAATDQENIKIINQDILKFNPSLEFEGSYKIVANLPYNITSIFLRSVLSSPKKPELLVLMLQEEVANRIIAEPGKMSLLALSVQHYAQAEIVHLVPAHNFWPEPKVNSAVIRLRLKSQKFSLADDKLFFRLLKAGFSAKRKMLKNNLAGGLKLSAEETSEILSKAKINNKIRAEDLSLEDWYKLFAASRGFML